MPRRMLEKSKGILNEKVSAQNFHLARYLPSPDLSFFIEHYWTIHWDLRGQTPYLSQNLPQPNVNISFEPGGARVVGVINSKFTYLVEGKGHVFGIKFRNGGFYPFVKTPITKFTDASIPFVEVFGEKYQPLVDKMRSLEDDEDALECAEDFLCSCLPNRDDNVTLISDVIEQIINDRTITKVDDIVERMKINKRTLQRLFSLYVGTTPKWVIKRYRLVEAAEQLGNGEETDYAKMALELGYFDQAHFIKDFKALVGKTPIEYAKSVGLE